ncbi:Glutamate--tRNA ligase [Caulobacter sp. NIBR1757]|nr:Glutamate--tRNA ligase [Caulobacter sp. NIBR1757]
MPYVVRLKSPLTGTTVVEDHIQGRVSLQNRDLEDQVLLRSDGVSTYNLAVVVDDHDMGITHVIRGEDHLSNAVRQSLIYQAFGWEAPLFAHLPGIHDADGIKLSKRHRAPTVGELARLGYLPEALRNYLTQLGWSHAGGEIFSDAEAIKWFDIADIDRAPGQLDIEKLNLINGHYLRQADDDRLAALVAETLAGRGQILTEGQRAALWTIVPALKDKGAMTLLDLAGQAAVLLENA